MKTTLYILPNPFHGVMPTDGSERTPLFDGYELSLIGHYEDATDGECRRIDSEADLASSDLIKTTWSIYGHYAAGSMEQDEASVTAPLRGVDHIMDAGDLDHALTILRGIGAVSEKQAAEIKAEQGESEPPAPRGITYLFTDLSGRGISNKLSEAHIRKSWDLTATHNDDETLTLEQFLKTSELGDTFRIDQDLLTHI